MHANEYLLDNRSTQAGLRFRALAVLFDPTTFRHIASLGIAPGWRCWEVGAGGDSVPQWLAERVGPAGFVLATDIDTSWAGDSAVPLMIRRHDIARDDAPDGDFDLIHARLVLVHLAERSAALGRMVDALRPGGWLVVEDADPDLQSRTCLEQLDDEHVLANQLRNGFRELLLERGVDLAFGRKLPRLLREAGLTEVAADAYFPVAQPACAALETATVQLVRDRLLARGLATTDQLERHLAAVAAGRLDLATSPLISAWGRRASER